MKNKNESKTELDSSNSQKRVFARLISREISSQQLMQVSGGKWQCWHTNKGHFNALDCGNVN